MHYYLYTFTSKAVAEKLLNFIIIIIIIIAYNYNNNVIKIEAIVQQQLQKHNCI